jgi:hypothetical protein
MSWRAEAEPAVLRTAANCVTPDSRTLVAVRGAAGSHRT